jgi:uncharacterized phiE125 gp8 family phage protein
VRTISVLEALAAEGAAVPIAAGDHSIDIDANGDGWVRVTEAIDGKRVRVGFTAGLATEWSEVPEPLRQGVVRLAAHLYTHRAASDGAGPPAAVTALWRPWRRMRLS